MINCGSGQGVKPVMQVPEDAKSPFCAHNRMQRQEPGAHCSHFYLGCLRHLTLAPHAHVCICDK